MAKRKTPDWMRPSPALKRMAEAKMPERFRRPSICSRGHLSEIDCGEDCVRLEYIREMWEDWE